MRARIPLLLSLLLCAGCAFSAVNRPLLVKYEGQYQHAQTFEIPGQEAVESSTKALTAMGFEIQAVTPELGTIRTRERAVAVPQVCDCGTWNGVPVQGAGVGLMMVNVTPRAGATEIAIELRCVVDFIGRNLYGAPTRHETYQCASRGDIEREFWSTLRRILEAHKSNTG